MKFTNYIRAILIISHATDALRIYAISRFNFKRVRKYVCKRQQNVYMTKHTSTKLDLFQASHDPHPLKGILFYVYLMCTPCAL